MTLADDGSFSIGEESKWSFVGATDQAPFRNGSFATLPLVYLPTHRSALAKGRLSGSLCRMAWTAISGSGSGRGGLLYYLASH